MAYITRTFGRRFRHDPARFGIFIHGGTNDCPKWEPGDSDRARQNANRFAITLPTCTPELKDTAPEMERIRSAELLAAPTFQRALGRAVRFREEHPELARCGIYACTDFHFTDGRAGGSLLLQKVA